MNRVGVPTKESELTVAAQVFARTVLLPPNRGRQLIVLTEVEIGVGRPDLVLLSFSPIGLLRRAQNGPRLRSFTEARLAAALSGPTSANSPWARVGITRSHAQRLKARLRAGGWFGTSGQVKWPSSILGDSLVLEAKISTWKAGLRQLVQVRRMTHRAALLLPGAKAMLVDRRPLEKNRLGLVAYLPGHLKWIRIAPMRPLAMSSEIWLTELAVRDLLGEL